MVICGFFCCQRWSSEPGGSVWGFVNWSDSRSWTGRHRPRTSAHQPPTVYPQKLWWGYHGLNNSSFFCFSDLFPPILQWFSHTLQVHLTPPATPCPHWRQTTSSWACGASQWSRSSSCRRLQFMNSWEKLFIFVIWLKFLVLQWEIHDKKRTLHTVMNLFYSVYQQLKQQQYFTIFRAFHRTHRPLNVMVMA